MPSPKDGKTVKPVTKNEEQDSKKKKGCCKKKKKEEKEDEPKEKKKKGCCKKEKKEDEPEGKKKNSGCCQKKKQPEKDEEEQSRVDDDEGPHVHVCNCCIYVRFGSRKNARPSRLSSNKKCCDCKCKWKQLICIITWIVIIVCFILGLVFCIGYYEFVEVVLDQHDYITWIMIACYIWFVFASSVFFLIVTKLQCATQCCVACKLVWFFVLHIPFGCITLVLIYLTANPTREEAFNAHILETKMNEEHYWLAYLQHEYECCFTTDDGTQFGDPHIIETCEKYVDTSRKKNNFYDIEFNEIAVQRCDYLLYEIYDDTMTMGGIFTLVLLIIGVIPFVIYTMAYVKQRKIAPEDAEDKEKEDEESSEEEEERKDKNKKKPKQDHVDENNNKNQTKDKDTKQKSQKDDKAKKAEEKPKKSNDKTKQEPKKGERKQDQKRDKK